MLRFSQPQGVIRGMSVHMPGNTMYGATKMFLDGFSRRLNLEEGLHSVELQSVISGCTISNFDKSKNDKAPLRAAIPTFLWSTVKSVVEASLFACLWFRTARWAVSSENFA